MKSRHHTKTIGLSGCIGAALGVVMATPLWSETWGPSWAWSPVFKHVATAPWYELLHFPSQTIVWLWSVSPIPFISPHGRDAEPMMNAWIIAIVIQWTVIGFLAGAIAAAWRNRAAELSNPQGAADGRQPFTSGTNRTSAAAASGRSPWMLDHPPTCAGDKVHRTGAVYSPQLPGSHFRSVGPTWR